MSQVITNAFEQYWQSSLAAEQPVVLDEFVLADIPNLDITSPINPDAGLPPAGQIVYRQDVDQRGRVNNNAVAYSIVMDTAIGDFSFNAMYLRNKANGVVGMIVYKGRETKLKTDLPTAQTGNSLVKSMLMGYDQAAEATLTNVDAGTWQIDYSARLRGQDEDLRQLASQLYGHHTFIDDGFKVVQQDGNHQVTPGVAIVEGLRIELKQAEVIHPGSKPIGVWVDVYRAGSLLSEHQNHFTIITSVADLTDHVDGNGYQHYVAKLATVQADSSVVDGRGQGGSELLRNQLSLPNGVDLVGGAAREDDVLALEAEVLALETDVLALKTDVATIPSITDLSRTSVNLANANLNAFGRLYSRNNIVLIGDSITAGVGASVPEFAYASLFGQAVANYYKDGYNYPLIRNTGGASYIWTHNGSAGSAGLSGDSISLNGPSQWVGFYPSEGDGIIAYVEVAAGTATTIQLIINGTVVASSPLSGSVYEAFLTIPQGVSWTSADDVKVTSPSGTLVLSGITVLRYGNSVVNASNASPLMITCGHSGESFEYYRTYKSLAAAMANSFLGSGPSTYIIALGTNSIYNAGKAQTPAEYVASMIGLETDLHALDVDISVIFTIPPQANESLWPVIKPGYVYQDYVDAIKAAIPTYKLIDVNIPYLPYSDGVHPDSSGHIAIARRMCEALGIPFDVEPPRLLRTAKLVGSTPVIINNGYVSRDVHGVKYLSGQALPNGAGTNLITTISNNEYRPRHDRYAAVALLGTSNGIGIIHISAANGEVRLVYNSVVWTSAYLDGISFI